MKCWVQFLTTPTADTPGTTLMLHFDAKRYLIGHIAEGTQRAATQRKIGLIKVSDIFLTGKTEWKTTGGLLGMILTIADSVTGSVESSKANQAAGNQAQTDQPKQFLNIHGGTNLTHMLATARRFVFRKGLPIHTQEFRSTEEEENDKAEPTWQDDFVKVWAMPLEPNAEATSPRKRSHDEFRNDVPAAPSNKSKEIKEKEDQDDQIRKGVVADMFFSKWRLDALVTKKLSEVVLPATIFFRNAEGKIEKYDGPMIDDRDDVADIDVLVRNPWPGAMVKSLPPTKPVATAVSYIIRSHTQRGKFLPQVARQLGVKPGPAFAQLTSGQPVTTADGTVVTPDQVMEKSKPGGGFAVIDIPDKSYVEALVNRKEWSAKDVVDGIGAVIWILGPGVIDDPRIQKFMEDHQDYKHMVSSPETCSNYLALESPAEAAIRLHLLDPERFPIPIHSNDVLAQGGKKPSPLYEPARVGNTIQLEPRMEIQNQQVVQHLDTKKVVLNADPVAQELADKARKEITSEAYLRQLEDRQQDIPSKDAEIITLGTGSALPSKYRNVSATLLRVPGYGSYLFDCGENTLGQLGRVFGDELPGVLRDLKAIWISHLHADHHLGTSSVIRAWNNETRGDDKIGHKKLMVASDRAMIDWLREYSEIEAFGNDRVQHVTMGQTNGNYHEVFDADSTEWYGLESIQSCRVDHCSGAMAVSLNFPHGFKVSYSGDCRPSKRFIDIGQGSTVLIHEATFDDELQGDALAKKHCTTSEALDIGKQMNARRIVLTHFSQRYQKIPVMQNNEGKDQVAIVAFDYMRVKVGDIAKVEAFKPALMKLYEDKDDK
jgi:ribonuclease Z